MLWLNVKTNMHWFFYTCIHLVIYRIFLLYDSQQLELIFLLSKTLNFMKALLYSSVLSHVINQSFTCCIVCHLSFFLCINNFVNDNGKSFFTPPPSLSLIIHDYCLQDIWFFIPSNINALKLKISTSSKWSSVEYNGMCYNNKCYQYIIRV